MQEKLLGSSQAELLVEQLNEVIRQLKEHPSKLPVLEPPQSPARKPPSSRVNFLCTSFKKINLNSIKSVIVTISITSWIQIYLLLF